MLGEAELDRLTSLRSYEVLGTPPESGFDGLTALVSLACRAPVALVSFVDAERQWFNPRRGVDIIENRRKESFCAHALLSSDILKVPDTHRNRLEL